MGHGLEWKCMLSCARNAEVVGATAQGKYEVVVRDLDPLACNRFPLAMDPLHLNHPEVHVSFAAEDRVHRVYDVARFELGAPDLVEERDEGVIVVPVEYHHVHRPTGQRFRRLQPGKPCSNDHDARSAPMFQGVWAWGYIGNFIVTGHAASP